MASVDPDDVQVLPGPAAPEMMANEDPDDVQVRTGPVASATASKRLKYTEEDLRKGRFTKVTQENVFLTGTEIAKATYVRTGERRATSRCRLAATPAVRRAHEVKDVRFAHFF